MGTKTALTWEDFLAAGEEWQRWEYVNGKIEFMSPGNAYHGAVLLRLSMMLGKYCELNPGWLGFASETAFTMVSGNWRCPDAALLRAERFPGRHIPTTPIPFPADVAFEILSPGDTAVKIQRKREDYQGSGVIQVWIDAEKRLVELVYPDRPAQFFQQDQPLVIDRLADFSLDVKNLFSI